MGMSVALTLISGFSTGLGGLIAAFLASPGEELVGQMEAFSGGVMLFLSLFDLVPEAAHVLGLPATLVGVSCGAVLFWAIARLVPDPSQPFSNALAGYLGAQHSTLPPSTATTTPSSPPPASSRTASSSSPSSSALRRSLVRRTSSERDDAGCDPETGLSLGAMEAMSAGGSAAASAATAAGGESGEKQERRMVFFRMAFITALGISIHNFPEGVALYLSTMKGLSFGVGLALTISLHNIPEGLAVAVPIAYTTRSRFWTIAIPFLTGMFEPLGAIVAGLFLHPFITEERLHFLLAMVAGIMSFISLNELVPVAVKHCGAYPAALATGAGMFFCKLFLFAAAMLPTL
ncbi:metal cation transporter, ZIP subfamily protein [Acanthamoeba castellanii str. Neff]|uniref:Metal cation transporter, ZIP subfamily protein n=1 Tax=Acanthamoeba castellanii (strain ATCC 30010 / Neff) TaxID=1257118 RepID=L8GWV5_ACACF|nr:metal cation transporter, ZIP subfamily protein [Acanthamoeba castellanii str. Neff]ELR17714.1 metal cation transporter, ZIP subfamily protein [Acanthamoeba castellanii str. Neff]